MAQTFINWLQDFIKAGKYAGEFLTSQPFKSINGLPEVVRYMTPLALIGLSGLIIFIGIAVIKWVIS